MSTTSTQITKETTPRLGRRASLGRTTGAILAAAALTLGAGCGAEPIQTEDEVIDTAASALTLQQLQQSFVNACSATVRATYGAAFAGSCTVSNFTRTVIDASQSIVEYKVDVQVGPGAHDSIGLHRVVKETSAYTPAISSNDCVLYSNNESCTCLAEPIGTPPPHDDGSLCAIDPCLNKTPVCQNSICVVSSGSDG